MRDVIVIGAGAAGLTAAMYCGRSGADVLVMEKYPVAGGQMNLTDTVSNYPGMASVTGMEISGSIRKQALASGAEFMTASVRQIKDGRVKTVVCDSGEYTAGAVIYAAGAQHRKLGVKDEDKYLGRGLSYCAVCDGGFYRNRTVAVIGGGDTALKEALYLSEICSKVYLIHRRSSFRGNALALKKCEEKKNISIIRNTVCTGLQGEDRLTRLSLYTMGEEYFLDCGGVFAAVGMEPVNAPVKDICLTDGNGYIVAGEDCITSVPGIFAAGDVRTKPLRQIITACADGAEAANSAENYLKMNLTG
ncbi:MAG: FAD-dependent oxidoreductase [Ruminococcus sp.]|nr:FAD-dependent oxidoreductase [Ruminococcus sp.]